MSPTLDMLTQQALALPADQRYELVQRVWSSIEDQYGEDEVLFAEIERREAEMESSKVKPIPFDQAMREIRRPMKV